MQEKNALLEKIDEMDEMNKIINEERNKMINNYENELQRFKEELGKNQNIIDNLKDINRDLNNQISQAAKEEINKLQNSNQASNLISNPLHPNLSPEPLLADTKFENEKLKKDNEIYRNNNSNLSKILSEKEKELKALKCSEETERNRWRVEKNTLEKENQELRKNLNDSVISDQIRKLSEIIETNNNETQRAKVDLENKVTRLENEINIGINSNDYVMQFNIMKDENTRLKEKLIKMMMK